MRSSPFLLLTLLLAGLPACNGTGGSEELGAAADTFEIVGAAPADGAPTVPVTATVVITFNTTIDATTVTGGTLSANHPIFGEPVVDGAKLRFDPSTDLTPGTTYVFNLSPDLKGTNGISLGVVPPYGFKTAGTLPPPPDTTTLSPPRPR